MQPKRRRPRQSADDKSLPKYSIAVASDLSGVSQQQLRRLEEGGFVNPGRTNGNTRRYSDDDLALIADVSELADEGVNAAGIRHIMQLRSNLRALQQENEALRQQLAAREDGHHEHAPEPGSLSSDGARRKAASV